MTPRKRPGWGVRGGRHALPVLVCLRSAQNLASSLGFMETTTSISFPIALSWS